MDFQLQEQMKMFHILGADIDFKIFFVLLWLNDTTCKLARLALVLKIFTDTKRSSVLLDLHMRGEDLYLITIRRCTDQRQKSRHKFF